MISTSTIAQSLKETLDLIVDDDTDGIESRMEMRQWLDDSDDMTDAYHDELEMGGPGLASEKAEGAEIALGTINEGVLARYIARTFAMKLIVTDEALEDAKYPEAINAARRLKRALAKTADIDATFLLVRAFSSSYPGADGVALGSSSHTLPNGGTFSNIMATPMSASRAAMTIAVTQLARMPGHDGIVEGYEAKKVVYPKDQWATWAGLLKSTHAPEAGEFNEINVVNSELDLVGVGLKYWTNTTTNWGIITDAENGLKFRWRRKMKSKSWIDNDQGLMKYSISARWARGWTDPRGFYGVNL